MTDSAADSTTTTPRTLPSDAPTPKRGSGRPRKPPATPKPKRPKSGALWTNAAGEHYVRITTAQYNDIAAVQRDVTAMGFTDSVVVDAVIEKIPNAVALRTIVAGKLTRALEGLKGGAGEGA